MPEDDVLKLEAVDRPDVDRLLGTVLDRLFHQGIEIADRSLRLPVGDDDVAELLERPENRRGDELHGDQLARREDLAEDKPQEDEEDRLLEDVDRRPLEEGKGPNPADLVHLQAEDVLGQTAEADDLGFHQAQAFHQLDVPQRLGDDSGHLRVFPEDGPLDRLDSTAQKAGHPAEEKDADGENRDEGPVLRDRVPDEEDEADDRGEQDVDERVDEHLRVAARPLECGDRLAAPLLLEFLVAQPEGLLHSVVEDPHPEFLDDQPEDVVLESPGQSGGHGHTDGHGQPEKRPGDELFLRLMEGVEGVLVDDLAENHRVDQG